MLIVMICLNLILIFFYKMLYSNLRRPFSRLGFFKLNDKIYSHYSTIKNDKDPYNKYLIETTIAITKINENKHRQAYFHLNKALLQKNIEKNSLQSDYIDLYSLLGSVEVMLNRNFSAFDFYKEAISKIQACQNEATSSYVHLFFHLAIYLINFHLTKKKHNPTGQAQMKSLEALEKLTTMLEVEQDEKIKVPVHIAIAEFFANNDSPEETLVHLRKASRICIDKIEDKNVSIPVFNKIADLYLQIGEIEKSIYYLEKAVSYMKELYVNPSFFSIIILLKISDQKSMLKRFEEAEDDLKDALQLIDKLDLREKKIFILTKLGDIYEIQGDYNNAILYLEKAINLLENIKFRDEYTTATILERIGDLYQEIGKNDKAKVAFQKALPFLKELNGISKIEVIEEKIEKLNNL